MDNRGFAPGEGKQGFPYQGMNGNYPAVYYPGQEMVMPYGQYAPPGAEVPFNDQCAIPQQVTPVTGNMSYGFGAHQYMQQYRQQQAQHIMQAAYNTAQHQGRVATNPQQIADSIYNMAAHAYNYQQQAPSLPPTMPNPYSPGTNGHTLSVRTGPSPANSLHSPAGSTHSIGERPLLSPHVQANASMYSYQQTNHQPNNRHTHQHLPQPQPNMANYYSNGAHNPTHPPPAPPPSAAALNGCITSDLDHRQSVERLAAISHPSDQFNHAAQKLNPAITGNSNMASVPQSQPFYPQAIPTSTNMAAPTSCSHASAPTAAPVSTKRQSKGGSHKNSKTQNRHQVNSKPTVSLSQSSKPISPPANKVDVVVEKNEPQTEQQQVISNEEPKGKEVIEEEEETKPKEAAVDSGIDSEQVDKDNEEEHDTSTTSNKSENSPQPVKPPCDLLNDTTECITSATTSITVKSPGERVIDCSGQGSEDTTPVDKAEEAEPATSPNVATSIGSGEGDDVGVLAKATTEGGAMSEPVTQTHTSSIASDLNDSFISSSSVDNNSNSLSNSCASKQSMGDESRLPPRKRKQHLSEHTESLTVPVPLKKRGRPSKEAVRLREAAKSAVAAAQLAAAAEAAVEKEYELSLPEQTLVKEKKQPGKDKSKKPVHSGSLLHSPKFNPGQKLSKDDQLTDGQIPNKLLDRKDGDHAISHEKKLASLEEKSNAVLVSPPKKPKASVSEMQKALMRVVSSDTGEICFPGKRKRGRPLGSKNKKTRLLDHRARSNSASSSNKGQFPVRNVHSSDTVYQPIGVCTDPYSMGSSVEAAPSSTPSTALTANTFQSQNLSSSVQNRVKSLHIKKSKNVSPKYNTNSSELKLPVSSDPWVCVFCNQISNYKDMGDLFGGYNVQPNTSLAAKVACHRKTSDLRQQQQAYETTPPNEIWFHERCIIWAPGVYMVAGKLYGVYEAISAAYQTTCSLCRKKGAILGCYCKGCTYRYHIHCAMSADCTLNEDNFSMLCTKHKDKKIVLM